MGIGGLDKERSLREIRLILGLYTMRAGEHFRHDVMVIGERILETQLKGFTLRTYLLHALYSVVEGRAR
jgi:hypothetical protein